MIKKKGCLMALIFTVLVGMNVCWFPSSVQANNVIPQEAVTLNDGVNIVKTGGSNATYDIGDGQAVMIANQNNTEPIVFENCVFNLSGKTVKISGNQDGITYHNGEVITKLWIGGNVQFKQCRFITDENGMKSSTAGYDACIYFFSGNIVLSDCELSANGYNGQFLGLYGQTGSVTFDHSTVRTINNKNGWSYAMYGGSVLKLINQSTMTATGMSTESGNTNAFYSGDNKTQYDAIFVEDSTIDFSDNQAGGFAINNVNIYVDNSTIKVNDNKGNACNSGMWYVTNSTIQMNGNKGGHALSCVGFEMKDSILEILHNGYAGVYIQSKDSLLENCTVDLRCNGEKMLSYSAGDLWLNGNNLNVINCTSKAHSGSAWLGAVGRKGNISTSGTIEVKETSSVVAYDLNSNAKDNLKSNTTAVLTTAQVEDIDIHTLFLNPFMESDYARGNAENTANNNDADLFEDDHIMDGSQERDYIISKDSAKIGTLTTAQLSHHVYDFENGEVILTATSNKYGVLRYECMECHQNMNHTSEHPCSFDCQGTYVYAPLVSLVFDKNTTDEVSDMPSAQTEIIYGCKANDVNTPTRAGYRFVGWYVDKEGKIPFDFNTSLSTPLTTVYAKWVPQTTYLVEHQYYTSTNGGEYQLDGNQLSETMTADVSEKISAAEIEKITTYNDNTYHFDHASDDLVLVEDATQNKIILVYYRDVKVEIDVEPEEPIIPDTPESPQQPQAPEENVQTSDTLPVEMIAFGLTLSAIGVVISIRKKYS